MNNSPATQSTAAAASGAGALLAIILVWVLQQFGITMPDQVALAIGTLLSTGVHYIIVSFIAGKPTPPAETAPDEWLLDFSNVLPSGDTIKSIATVSVAPTDMIIGATVVAAGVGGASLAVGVNLSGGTIGNQYVVTAKVVTAQGNQFARSIIIPVQVR
jgi:hypothetical protein